MLTPKVEATPAAPAKTAATAAAAAHRHADAPPFTLHLGKDVSVGEYDAATSLTLVTRQRGRLHFHMGVNAAKSTASPTVPRDRGSGAAATARAATNVYGNANSSTTSDAAAASVSDTSALDNACTRAQAAPPLRTGAFTGLALYPEEAYYLLQRGALVIFELESPPRAPSNTLLQANPGALTEAPRSASTLPQPLSTTQFVALLLCNNHASLACLDTYVHLKQHQFYPRRHCSRTPDGTRRPRAVDTQASDDNNDTSLAPVPTGAVHNAPRHYDPSVDAVCSIAFDVWQSSTETIYIPNSDINKSALRQPLADTASPALDHVANAAIPQANTQMQQNAEAPPLLSSLAAVATGAFRTTHKKQKSSSSSNEKRAMTKRKVKRLQLAFCVVVCRFTDTAPPAHALSSLRASDGADADSSSSDTISTTSKSSQKGGSDSATRVVVPLKLAVVDADQSVLFFEVATAS